MEEPTAWPGLTEHSVTRLGKSACIAQNSEMELDISK